MSKSKAPEIPSLTTVPEYAEALATVQRVRKAQTENESAIREAEAEARTDGREGRVAAILDGSEADTDAPADQLRRLHKRRVDLNAALKEAERRLASTKGRASAEICEGLMEVRRAQMRELAEAILAMAVQADAVAAFQAALDAEGIGWTGAMPPIALTQMRASRSDSRASLLIREIERDYGFTLDRPNKKRGILAAVGAGR